MPFTKSGYQRRTYTEWLALDEQRAKEIFGDDIDTSESTPLGKFMRLQCEDLRDLEEELEDVYLSFNYKTASGTALRRLCGNIGMTVSPGTYAQHEVTFTGTVGFTIPAGFNVTDKNRSVMFHTINPVTIGSDGKATASVECDKLGTNGNLETGAINTIAYTNADVTAVSASVLTHEADDEESDTAIRARYKAAMNAFGNGSYSSILGGIYQIAGVKSATIKYNDTMTDVDGGLPAKSFTAYVLADDSLAEEIAETIFKKMPIGVRTVGDNSVSVEDDWGKKHTINFSWITEVPVYVNVTLLVNSSWTDSMASAVKEAIADLINNIGVGRSVYAHNTMTALSGITGIVNITSLGTGKTKDAATSEANTEIAEQEVAQTNAELITITTTVA